MTATIVGGQPALIKLGQDPISGLRTRHGRSPALRGDRYLNKRNTALAPAFSTVGAGIGFRTSRAEYRVDLRNLTNRRDAVSESEFGDAQYYRMPAATFRTSIVVRY